MEKLRKIIIKPEATVKQALKLMDQAGKKILFVVDSKASLLGTVTDGDIRRWILEGRGLQENISKIMNKEPISLKDGYSIKEANELMAFHKIECIPIVDEKKRIISAIWWFDFFKTKPEKHAKINIPVVVMAGGGGTRLAPFTDILPKALIPIGEKPILERIIERFQEYGCKNFYLSLNYKSNLIKAYFNDFEHNYNIEYIDEKKPLGTAGSLYLLKGKIKTTFYLNNCDILIEADYADIIDFHRNNKNKITLVTSMKHYTIPYGVCEIENGGNLRSIMEKPEYDFLVNSGMYVLEPEILSDIPRNRFYNITDLINNCMKKSKKIGVYPISEKSWLDMGEWEQLKETLNRFKVK